MTPMTTSIPRVTAVDVLDGYTVRLGFKDGAVGDVDLAYLLKYGPVFRPLHSQLLLLSNEKDGGTGGSCPH